MNIQKAPEAAVPLGPSLSIAPDPSGMPGDYCVSGCGFTPGSPIISLTLAWSTGDQCVEVANENRDIVVDDVGAFTTEGGRPLWFCRDRTATSVTVGVVDAAGVVRQDIFALVCP